jgi:hypothetical protein
MYIDKAGCHQQATRVYFPCGGCLNVWRDARDNAVSNTYITCESRGTTAVDDFTLPNNQVVLAHGHLLIVV